MPDTRQVLSKFGESCFVHDRIHTCVCNSHSKFGLNRLIRCFFSRSDTPVTLELGQGHWNKSVKLNASYHRTKFKDLAVIISEKN